MIVNILEEYPKIKVCSFSITKLFPFLKLLSFSSIEVPKTPIKIDKTNIPPSVTRKEIILNGQPLSAPIAPESRALNKLCQILSINPRGS